jgi:hypothetical protein
LKKRKDEHDECERPIKKKKKEMKENEMKKKKTEKDVVDDDDEEEDDKDAEMMKKRKNKAEKDVDDDEEDEEEEEDDDDKDDEKKKKTEKDVDDDEEEEEDDKDEKDADAEEKDDKMMKKKNKKKTKKDLDGEKKKDNAAKEKPVNREIDEQKEIYEKLDDDLKKVYDECKKRNNFDKLLNLIITKRKNESPKQDSHEDNRNNSSRTIYKFKLIDGVRKTYAKNFQSRQVRKSIKIFNQCGKNEAKFLGPIFTDKDSKELQKKKLELYKNLYYCSGPSSLEVSGEDQLEGNIDADPECTEGMRHWFDYSRHKKKASQINPSIMWCLVQLFSLYMGNSSVEMYWINLIDISQIDSIKGLNVVFNKFVQHHKPYICVTFWILNLNLILSKNYVL